MQEQFAYDKYYLGTCAQGYCFVLLLVWEILKNTKKYITEYL